MTDVELENRSDDAVSNESASHRSHFGTALACLLIGASAGAIAALLLTPKDGSHMRRALRNRYEDAVDTLSEWGEQAGEQAEDLAGEAVYRGVELSLAARRRASELRERVTE